MSQSRLTEDLTRLFNDAAGLAGGVRREAETIARTQMERLASHLDLVTREEFEALREMAIKAREQNEELALRIAELEKKILNQP